MRPIPPALRSKLSSDPFMRRCAYPHCNSKDIEFHHAIIYRNRQLNEAWAIIPLCHEHHNSQEGRDYAELLALQKMPESAKQVYNKRDWDQRLKELEFKLQKHGKKEE